MELVSEKREVVCGNESQGGLAVNIEGRYQKYVQNIPLDPLYRKHCLFFEAGRRAFAFVYFILWGCNRGPR